MGKQIVTRRQKDISQLLRERKQAYPDRLKARKTGRVGRESYGVQGQGK